MPLFGKKPTETEEAKVEFEMTGLTEDEVTSEADVQAVMEKYDRESNVRLWDGIPKTVVRYMLVAFAVYSILLNFGLDWETRIERASFVGILVFLIFIVFPSRKGAGKKRNYIPWYDVILAVLGGGSYFYFVLNLDSIIANTIRLSPVQIAIGIIGVVVTLEACRRAVGIPIVIVSSCFIIYMLFFAGKPLAINIYNLFYTTEGVIGTPIRACSTFIVLFVIFGAFLERTGISQFFIELANSIAGGSSGGPAKVAVISSALCGMVSGSSVGNTVTTGSVTIPMMKKNGYRPEFAGAVEAASSTGGQIMPPIMGAAAFLMVEYTSFEYGFIAARAVLPAALYFAGIFIAVHLEAKRMGLRGLSRDQLPKFGKLFVRKGYLLLPLILLVVMIMKTTMSLAAIIATACAIVVSMFMPGSDTAGKIAILLSMFAFGAIGFIDDYNKVAKKQNEGLTPKQKLVLQAVFGLALAVFMMAKEGTTMLIPFIGKTVDIGLFYIPFVMFIEVAMANAVNLTDGLDGLASSTSAIVACTFAVIGMTVGSGNEAMAMAGQVVP